MASISGGSRKGFGDKKSLEIGSSIPITYKTRKRIDAYVNKKTKKTECKKTRQRFIGVIDKFFKIVNICIKYIGEFDDYTNIFEAFFGKMYNHMKKTGDIKNVVLLTCKPCTDGVGWTLRYQGF